MNSVSSSFNLFSNKCCLLFVIFFLLLPLTFSTNVTTTTSFTVSSTTVNETKLKPNDEQCYVKRNGFNWKLLYHQEFENNTKLEDDWTIEHEVKSCHGDYVRHVSCNVRENVHQTNGYLALFAQHEPYLDRNFTAALITSKGTFGYGRWEVRASQPLGFLMRSVMFTVHPKDNYWHENGLVDMGSNQGEPSTIYRGLFPANSRDRYEPVDLSLTSGEDLHKFHLYGIEWNRTLLRFFFDDHYSRPFKLSPNGSDMNPGAQIRFQLGVGLEAFGQPAIPAGDQLGARLRWKCPAYVVDYVRAYEKVEEGDFKEVDLSSNCDEKWGQGGDDDDDKLEKVCRKSMEKAVFASNNKIENESSNSTVSGSSKIADFFGSTKFTFTMALLIVVIILVAYLLIQIKKIQRKSTSGNSDRTQGVFNQNDDLYCNPNDEDYYEVAHYDSLAPLENQLSAMNESKLENSFNLKNNVQHEVVEQRVSNEYVPIKE